MVPLSQLRRTIRGGEDVTVYCEPYAYMEPQVERTSCICIPVPVRYAPARWASFHAPTTRSRLERKFQALDWMIARTAKASKDLTNPNLIGVNAGGFGFIAPPPARDPLTRDLIFEDASSFRPNMTPSEVLHAGAWGGGYFRDIYSSVIKQKCEQAWRELPADWIAGLNVDKQLASQKYNVCINKYKGSAPCLPT